MITNLLYLIFITIATHSETIKVSFFFLVFTSGSSSGMSFQLNMCTYSICNYDRFCINSCYDESMTTTCVYSMHAYTAHYSIFSPLDLACALLWCCAYVRCLLSYQKCIYPFPTTTSNVIVQVAHLLRSAKCRNLYIDLL